MAISNLVSLWVEKDTKCTNLMQKLSIDPQTVSNYFIQNGILRYKENFAIGSAGQLREQLFLLFHKSAIGGHSDERTTSLWAQNASRS